MHGVRSRWRIYMIGWQTRRKRNCSVSVSDHFCRHHLETIRADQIVWHPFLKHREVRLLVEIALYSGYIRCGKIRRPYLSERVFRQFGYIQHISPPPHPLPLFDAIKERWGII